MAQEDAPIAYPFPWSSLFHPSPVYAQLREVWPVPRVRTPDGNTAWLASRYADVRQVMLDPQFSRNMRNRSDVPVAGLARLAGESMIGMDPPEHTRLRKLVTSALTARRVETLRPRVVKLVDELLVAIQLQPAPADLVANFTLPLPIQVISELIGIPVSDQRILHEWSDTVMGDWKQASADFESALDGLAAYFAELVAEKRANPADDLMTALIAAHDDEDKLSEDELVGMCLGLLIAGHATTVSELTMSVLNLLHFTDQLALLQADDELIPQAVEELLRFVQLSDGGGSLPRITTGEVGLGGVLLPAGAIVMTVTNAANRDPDMYTDPDRLDLTRAPNQHISFGVGVHRCLGASLVRMEMQEALRGLFRHMPDLQLAVAESELRFKRGMFIRSLETLPVTW